MTYNTKLEYRVRKSNFGYYELVGINFCGSILYNKSDALLGTYNTFDECIEQTIKDGSYYHNCDVTITTDDLLMPLLRKFKINNVLIK